MKIWFRNWKGVTMGNFRIIRCIWQSGMITSGKNSKKWCKFFCSYITLLCFCLCHWVLVLVPKHENKRWRAYMVWKKLKNTCVRSNYVNYTVLHWYPRKISSKIGKLSGMSYLLYCLVKLLHMALWLEHLRNSNHKKQVLLHS